METLKNNDPVLPDTGPRARIMGAAYKKNGTLLIAT